MDFLNALYQDPLRYVEYIFAFLGSLGLLLFIAGFGSGFRHVFTYGEDDHHMAHARGRAMWGVLVCMVVLGLWEIVRVILGQVPLTYLWLSLILLTPLWIPWIKGLLSGKGGGGH
jgi:hypothetical protein